MWVLRHPRGDLGGALVEGGAAHRVTGGVLAVRVFTLVLMLAGIGWIIHRDPVTAPLFPGRRRPPLEVVEPRAAAASPTPPEAGVPPDAPPDGPPSTAAHPASSSTRIPQERP